MKKPRTNPRSRTRSSRKKHTVVAEGSAKGPSKPSIARRRVLVADDHAIVRRGVQALLEADGRFTVCGEAHDATGALAQARRLRPDVILLDLTLPDMNGLAVTRQILRTQPHSKILIFTMHDSEGLVREALDAGALGFVLKSQADHDLVAALEAVDAGGLFLGRTVSQMVLQSYLQAAREPAAHKGLTERQKQVATLLAGGQTNKEVAARLGISAKTVDTHRTIIMRKLELGSFSDLVRYAIREKLITA